MLSVIIPEEVYAVMGEAFPPRFVSGEVPPEAARGRVLFNPVTARGYVPGFARSADTLGCSDAIPAILTLTGEIAMGSALPSGCCMAMPTGGIMPAGADAAVILEYMEDYGDGSISICKSAAPGTNLIFKGDDVRPGQVALPAGNPLGIYSAAQLYNLDFLPICIEQCDLLTPDAAFDTPMVQRLLSVLQIDAFHVRLEALGRASGLCA